MVARPVEVRGSADRHLLRARRFFLAAGPPLLLLILSFPVLSFPFLTDDFNFLHRARSFTLAQLLPDAGVALYRPISREVYFGLLVALGGNNPLLGRLLNLMLALACIVLFTSTARRLLGDTVGLFAGLLFAALGSFPLLIGWTSCSQDLLAMLFTLVAIRLQLPGRTIGAVISMAAAMLSKETALFAVPALPLFAGIIDRNWKASRRNAIYYASLVIVWVIIYFKRGSVTRGLVTGSGGYTGLDNPLILSNIAHELAALANVPVGSVGWPKGLEWAAAAGLVILALTVRSIMLVRRSSPQPLSTSRVLLLGTLLGLVPAILTSVSVKHWFSYYACFPAIGTSFLLAVGAKRLAKQYVLPIAAVFLLLGVWTRGSEPGTRVTPAEQNFRVLSGKLRRIDFDLHRLHHSFPDSSRLYIAVNAPLESGLQNHLFTVQATQTWFWNGTLTADDPGRFRAGAGPEYLFWVTEDGGVFEITLPELNPRSFGPRPNYVDYQSTVRTFAYGLASAGQVDRGVDVILQMQEMDSLAWTFDRRLAATFLFARGRDAEAEKLCRELRPLPRNEALYAVAVVLGLDSGGLRLDDAAFRAYGIPFDDPESYRFLMMYFSDRVQLRKAKRMAERLKSMRPDDPEAQEMIDAINRVPNWEDPVQPVRAAPR